MIDALNFANAGNVSEGAKTSILAALENFKTLLHEGSIGPAQRRHIAQRAERAEIQPLQNIRQTAGRRNPALAGQFIERRNEDIDDPRRGQMALPTRIIGAVRIDQGGAFRRLGAH